MTLDISDISLAWLQAHHRSWIINIVKKKLDLPLHNYSNDKLVLTITRVGVNLHLFACTSAMVVIP